MRNTLLLSLFILSSNVFADGHEQTEAMQNNYMLLSTYEISAGQNPAELEKELVQLQKDQEVDGYNDCGLYRHWYGGERAFYAYCFFTDFDQLDAIHKAAEANEDRMGITQNYSSHTDHILELQQANLKEAPANLVWMHWEFGPYLTHAERQDRANLLFDAFNRAFGGCNLYVHSWGPSMGHYMDCGFEDFADFGTKHKAINKILEEELATADLDLLSHSDDLMTLVQD
jgi:hypothetical protein